MGYRLLAWLIVLLHFGFLVYLLLGGFLAWRWPRAIWPHLAAVAWGIAVIGAELGCPLTYAEHWARRQAGEIGIRQGFIDRYLEGVLYPERYTLLVQVLVAVVVAGSWIGLLLRYRRRRPAAG